jgi:hypothetical protein
LVLLAFASSPKAFPQLAEVLVFCMLFGVGRGLFAAVSIGVVFFWYMPFFGELLSRFLLIFGDYHVRLLCFTGLPCWRFFCAILYCIFLGFFPAGGWQPRCLVCACSPTLVTFSLVLAILCWPARMLESLRSPDPYLGLIFLVLTVVRGCLGLSCLSSIVAGCFCSFLRVVAWYLRMLWGRRVVVPRTSGICAWLPHHSTHGFLLGIPHPFCSFAAGGVCVCV